MLSLAPLLKNFPFSFGKHNSGSSCWQLNQQGLIFIPPIALLILQKYVKWRNKMVLSSLLKSQVSASIKFKIVFRSSERGTDLNACK